MMNGLRNIPVTDIHFGGQLFGGKFLGPFTNEVPTAQVGEYMIYRIQYMSPNPELACFVKGDNLMGAGCPCWEKLWDRFFDHVFR